MSEYYFPVLQRKPDVIHFTVPYSDGVNIADFQFTMTNAFITEKRANDIEASLNAFLTKRSIADPLKPISFLTTEYINRYEWRNQSVSAFLFVINPKTKQILTPGRMDFLSEYKKYTKSETIVHKPYYQIAVSKHQPTVEYYEDFVKHVVDVFKNFAKAKEYRGVGEIAVAKNLPPGMFSKEVGKYLGGKKSRKSRRKARKTRRRL